MNSKDCIDNIISFLPLDKQVDINKFYRNNVYKISINKIIKWYKKNKLRLEMEFEYIENLKPIIAYIFLSSNIIKRENAALYLLHVFPREYSYIKTYKNNLSRGLLRAMKNMDIRQLLLLNEIINSL